MAEQYSGKAFKHFGLSAIVGAVIAGAAIYVYDWIDIGPKGVPAAYGDDPRTGPPITPAPVFSPTFSKVVYLKFDKKNGAPSLDVKHAYFKRAQLSDREIKCALKDIKTGSNNCRLVVYENSPGNRFIPDNFDNFNAAQQQRVYVVINGSPSIGFYKKNPISFTPFGAFDDPWGTAPYTKNENHSFYNADVRDFDNGKDNLLYYENYFSDENGPLPEGSKKEYSLNFNIRMCGKESASCDLQNPNLAVPMVIDPDTGNGWGNEPSND